MKVKCPYCGNAKDVSDVNVGATVQCDCGKNFAAGIFAISSSVFVDGNAQVTCPYCREMLVVPEEAINRKVQCSSCQEKFRIVIQENAAPHNNANSDLPKQQTRKRRLMPTNPNSIANSILSEQAKKKNIDPAIAGSIIAGIIFAFIVVTICLMPPVDTRTFNEKKEETSYPAQRSSSSVGWVDDDECVANYISYLTQRDYAMARKWAKRIKNKSSRREALQVIDGTEKTMRAMGY